MALPTIGGSVVVPTFLPSSRTGVDFSNRGLAVSDCLLAVGSLALVRQQEDDNELVALAQAGDLDALDRLLRRHFDRIYGVCRRLAGNDADAADAAQEAMLAIVRGLDRFDGRARFTTWMYRVATNACLDELRRRGRRAVPSDVEDRAATAGPDVSVPIHVDVDAAVQKLNEDYRLPVVLRDFADLEYSEIAELLELPLGTVQSRIHRGRSQLGQLLGNNKDRSGRRMEYGHD